MTKQKAVVFEANQQCAMKLACGIAKGLSLINLAVIARAHIVDGAFESDVDMDAARAEVDEAVAACTRAEERLAWIAIMKLEGRIAPELESIARTQAPMKPLLCPEVKVVEVLYREDGFGVATAGRIADCVSCCAALTMRSAHFPEGLAGPLCKRCCDLRKAAIAAADGTRMAASAAAIAETRFGKAGG